MSSMNTVLETGGSEYVYAVAFHPDRKHLLGGGHGGIQRWRLEDGQEVRKEMGIGLYAISVSRDCKWVVCGTREGVSVWDGEMYEKIIDVEGAKTVYAVDVSPDSTKFATGTTNEANIWNITSGERLVGPLEHDNSVTGIKFSPTGDHIATACYGGSIHIFDARNGNQLIDIKTVSPSTWPNIPLAWSDDALQIFATSDDMKIRSFAVSTGSQIAESPILDGGDHKSITLAPNGKFIATYAGHSILFLDTSTLSHIVPAIEEKENINIYSIAISPDGSYIATGQDHGKINVRNLGGILPDLYGPFHASTREERQPDELSPTPADHHKKPPGSDPPETRSNDGDLLEDEVPTNTPAVQFDYDESLSPVSSVHSREDRVSPLDTPPAVSQPSDALPATSPPGMHPEEHRDIVESSQGIPMFKTWLKTRFRKIKKDQALHEPDRVRRKSHQAADHQSHSQSPARVEDSNIGPSRMAATKRVPRAVAKPVRQRKPKSSTKATDPSHPKKGASGNKQGHADPTGAGPAQQVIDVSHPPAETVHLTRRSDKAILSIAFPAWMCCGSGTGDATHP